MSIEALAIVLNHSKATGAVKLILMGVANHINPDNDGAWPSQVKLAGYANCTERYVRKALDELVKLGEIKFETHGGKSAGGNKSNRYWLTISCPPDCDGSVNHRIGKPRTMSQETPNSVTHTPNPSSAEPYIEPLNKPLQKPKPLQEDWQPDENLLAMFSTKWPLLDKEQEIEDFRLYYLAKGTAFVRWDLTFQKWMNGNQKKAAKNRPSDNLDVKGTF